MKRFAASFVILSIIILWTLALRQTEQQSRPASADLPTLTYVGEAVGETVFTVEQPGDNFVVKGKDGFWFMFVPGPIYTTSAGQRVWTSPDATEAPTFRLEEWHDFGPVTADCLIKYVGIDDEEDGRINRFYLADDLNNPIHVIEEGMVFSGQFNVPANGNLRLFAEDSIGAWITICEPTVTPDTPTPTPTGSATPPPRKDSCTRINFDVGGHVAQRGLYMVVEKGGRELASWFAEDGWEDSGWVEGIDISHSSVYVQVLYYSGDGTGTPVDMKILNPAPDTEYGWMSWGMCHALEVAWP